MLQTVQRQGVYSSAYGTVHHKEPLKSFEIRVGLVPTSGFRLSRYCHDCAESDVKQYSLAVNGIVPINWPNVNLILVHCRRRWPNIEPALTQCIMVTVVRIQHDILDQCCFIAGPASPPVGQRSNNPSCMCIVDWLQRSPVIT